MWSQCGYAISPRGRRRKPYTQGPRTTRHTAWFARRYRGWKSSYTRCRGLTGIGTVNAELCSNSWIHKQQKPQDRCDGRIKLFATRHTGGASTHPQWQPQGVTTDRSTVRSASPFPTLTRRTHHLGTKPHFPRRGPAPAHPRCTYARTVGRRVHSRPPPKPHNHTRRTRPKFQQRIGVRRTILGRRACRVVNANDANRAPTVACRNSNACDHCRASTRAPSGHARANPPHARSGGPASTGNSCGGCPGTDRARAAPGRRRTADLRVRPSASGLHHLHSPVSAQPSAGVSDAKFGASEPVRGSCQSEPTGGRPPNHDVNATPAAERHRRASRHCHRYRRGGRRGVSRCDSACPATAPGRRGRPSATTPRVGRRRPH